MAEPVSDIEQVEVLIRGMNAPAMPKGMWMTTVERKRCSKGIAAEEPIDHGRRQGCALSSTGKKIGVLLPFAITQICAKEPD